MESNISYAESTIPQTIGKLKRFYGIYEQEQYRFKSIDEYVYWQNEIKPHMSLDWEP
jgi:hypothetical protein